MAVTMTEELFTIIDQLAALNSKLGILKCVAEEGGSDAASDNIESAQDYVYSAVHDIRLAIRDLEPSEA